MNAREAEEVFAAAEKKGVFVMGEVERPERLACGLLADD